MSRAVAGKAEWRRAEPQRLDNPLNRWNENDA